MGTVEETAAAILAPPKGMLVADEYAEALTPHAAELALHTPKLAEYVSAVLLTRGAFAALGPRAVSLPAAPLRGMRANSGGAANHDRSVVEAAADDGAAFVEWRAHVSPVDVPSGSVHVDVDRLAAGASATQAIGLLAVLSVAMPELGASHLTVTQATTTNALLALRDRLDNAAVDPAQLLLRVNMVVPGSSLSTQAQTDQVARLTVEMLERALPPGIAGVLLLSGQQPLEAACSHLRAIRALAASERLPWQVTFGFARALYGGAALTGGDIATARARLVEDARLASAAVAATLAGDQAAT